jgi:hypothetical protein
MTVPVRQTVPQFSGPRRRRIAQWQNLDPPLKKKYRDDGGKAQDVTPLRFVCGCEHGHLQAIPWRWIVHGDVKCGEPMWLEEAGTSGDPRDTKATPKNYRFKAALSVRSYSSIRDETRRP